MHYRFNSVQHTAIALAVSTALLCQAAAAQTNAQINTQTNINPAAGQNQDDTAGTKQTAQAKPAGKSAGNTGILTLAPVQGYADSENPFTTPAAASQRKADILGQDTNTLLRSLPATFTQHDIGQGGIAVNIRGLEGMGRVNTQIDGVSQTFFESNPAHGWNGSTAYIDPNFISGITVERGEASGNDGAGALAGAVNFRTIEPSEILSDGKNYGARLILRNGTNGYGKNGMLAGAYRFNYGSGGSISLLSAVSGKKKYGYKNGAGETIASSSIDDVAAMESGLSSEATLNKIQIKPDESQELTLSYMGSRSRFANNHTPLKVTTQLGIVSYRFNPQSDLADINAAASYSHAKQYYIPTADADPDSAYIGRHTGNSSAAFRIENTAKIDGLGGTFTLNTGAKYMQTRYSSTSKDQSLFPAGTQTLGSVFADSTWERGPWEISAGLQYERYGMKGYLPPSDDDGSIVFPKGGDLHFSRQKNHLNPHINIAYQATDWLQLYGSWSKTSRGPNVQEFMYANNANGAYSVNPYLKGEESENRTIGLNINKTGLWKEDDALRFKASYFNNSVNNYIAQRQFYACTDASGAISKCNINNPNLTSAYGIYTNLPGKSRFTGFEFEGGYDAGWGYANLTYSQVKDHFAPDYLSDLGFSHIRSQPEYVWSLDTGARLLDKKLTIGTRLSRSGKDSIADGVDTDTDQQTIVKTETPPVLIDLYASYRPVKSLTLTLNIDNLTNRIYNYPLSGGTLGTGNLGSNKANWANKGTGRGRSIYAGFIWQL